MPPAIHRRLSAPKAMQSTVLLARCQEVDALHKQCGIYTKAPVVDKILDAVGWEDRNDLSQLRLLEPAAGNGAFVTEAARRLVISCRKRGISPTVKLLKNCIQAFEIHRREALAARVKVAKATRELGLHHATAKALARAWIKTGDFLLSPPSSAGYTHAVGNPPYVRWAKIPTALRTAYSEKLPRGLIGGDLFIPFLDRSLEQLRWHGRCGFLCSDRWRFMAFAETFRTKWLPQLEIMSENSLLAANAYVENVDAYPSILIASRTQKEGLPAAPALRSGKTIKDFGFKIRVGPALGHAAAFVLDEDEDDVERQLLRPWIDTSEVLEGSIAWRRRYVVAMHDNEGALIKPSQFPLLMKRLNRFRANLSRRSIVQNGAPWYRPIDRICPSDWAQPKLLIPEIAKTPRLAIDWSGAIPSHGVYAIFAPEGAMDALHHIGAEQGQLAKRAFDRSAEAIVDADPLGRVRRPAGNLGSGDRVGQLYRIEDQDTAVRRLDQTAVL